MQTDFPKEYVTLRSGQTDNYSEVYGHRWLSLGETDHRNIVALLILDFRLYFL